MGVDVRRRNTLQTLLTSASPLSLLTGQRLDHHFKVTSPAERTGKADRTKPGRKHRNPLAFETLEPRILLSGDRSRPASRPPS